MNRRLLTVTLAVVGLAASVGSAGVLYQTDFEAAGGYTAGAYLVGSTNPGSYDQDGWYGRKHTIAPHTNDATVTVTEAHRGSQSVRIPAEDYYYDTYNHTFAPQTSGVVSIEYWYMLGEWTTSGTDLYNANHTNNLFISAGDGIENASLDTGVNTPYTAERIATYTPDYIEVTGYTSDVFDPIYAGWANYTNISNVGQWKGIRQSFDITNNKEYLWVRDAGDSKWTQLIDARDMGYDLTIVDRVLFYQISNAPGGSSSYYEGDNYTYVDDIVVRTGFFRPEPITLLAAGFETAEGYPSAAGGQYDLAPGYAGDPANQQGWYSEKYFTESGASGTAYVSTANPRSGSQALMLPKTDTHYDYIRHQIAQKTAGVLTAEMWYYLEQVSTAAEPPATHPGKTTNNIYMMLSNRFDPDGNEYGQTGPGGEFEGHTAISSDVDATSQDSFWTRDSEYAIAAAGSAGAWRGVRAVIDLDAGMFDLYINTGGGWLLVAHNAPLSGLGAEAVLLDVFTVYQFSDWAFLGNNPAYFWGDTDTYVDDILITWSPPGIFGDANGDELVDSADLAVWQQHYDPLGVNENTFAMGDWNCDGLIDSADLALWQQNYDPIGGAGMGASHTPEPATLFVMTAAGLPLLLRRKRSAR